MADSEINPFSHSGLWPEDYQDAREQAEAELADALKNKDPEYAARCREVLRLVNEDIRSHELHLAETANYQRAAGVDTISGNESAEDDSAAEQEQE